MASKYEEMCAVAAKARKCWLDYRQRCTQQMASLVQGLVSYCEIPIDRVKYLRWKKDAEEDGSYTEPENDGGNYTLPGAIVIDDDGLCRLGLCVVLTPRGTYPERWASFGFCVYEKDGKVLAKVGDAQKSSPIDLNDARQRQELYSGIVERIKRSFAEPLKAGSEPLGFQVSKEPQPPENQGQAA
jgi:hypothetical protein